MNEAYRVALTDEDAQFIQTVGMTPEFTLQLLYKLWTFYDNKNATRYVNQTHYRIMNKIGYEQWLAIHNNTKKTLFIHADSTSGAKYITPNKTRLTASVYNYIIIEQHNKNIVLKVM